MRGQFFPRSINVQNTPDKAVNPRNRSLTVRNDIAEKPQNYQNSMNTYSDVVNQKTIWDKIRQVEQKNSQLLEILKRLAKNSLNSVLSEHLPSGFYQVQCQLKDQFNELIKSVQEFYSDIEVRLGQIVRQMCCLSEGNTHQTTINSPQEFFAHFSSCKKQDYRMNEKEILQSFNERICSLENDLNETKSNEAKLMNIVVKIIEKYAVNDQHLIKKEDPNLWIKISRAREKSQYQKFQQFHQFDPHRTLNFCPSNNPLQFNNCPDISNKIPFHSTAIKTSKSKQEPYLNLINQSEDVNPSLHQTSKSPLCQSIYQTLKYVEEPDLTPKYCQNPVFLNFNPERKEPKINLKHQNQRGGGIQIQSQPTEYQNGSRFIKNLLTVKNKSLGKLSLKNHNKNKEDSIDQKNKIHREFFMMKNLLT